MRVCAKSSKVCQENIPTLLHLKQPELLTQGRMDQCCHVIYGKLWPQHLNSAAEIGPNQTRLHQIFCRPCLVSSLNCSLSFLFFAERSDTWHDLLLLQPICFKVWHAVLSESSSACPVYNKWMIELLLHSYQLNITQRTAANWIIFSFSDHSL